ncbi:hypothetical protein BMS3Abin14_00596 [bacterium BMS3Abin14]|nr:hypothetical protein BMS3Abin14_00596 [bacterium BMS3Abin14]
MSISYHRPIYSTLISRLREQRRFIQVLAGPRQTGKTTLARQLMEGIQVNVFYDTADEPALKDRAWLVQAWETGRQLTERDPAKHPDSILILDEIQKIPSWSDTVKRLWDEDTARGRPLKVILLGSSPLLIASGLTESLAGRFELIPISHWSFPEMQEAFGWDLDRYIFFGGYPGSAPLADDYQRWSSYVSDALIETTISRDILLMTNVLKPVLLRRLFQLGVDYSGQVLSYNKMLGQLHDAGNTTTLAHYLELLAGAGLLAGLKKFAGSAVRRRASSPKLLILNTALMSAMGPHSFDAAGMDSGYWGRLVETAVGAHLVNTAQGKKTGVYYWREGNREVDFVLSLGGKTTAIEVKSGQNKHGLPGMEAFSRKFAPDRQLLVGKGGIPLEEFLKKPAEYWVQ